MKKIEIGGVRWMCLFLVVSPVKLSVFRLMDSKRRRIGESG